MCGNGATQKAQDYVNRSNHLYGSARECLKRKTENLYLKYKGENTNRREPAAIDGQVAEGINEVSAFEDQQ